MDIGGEVYRSPSGAPASQLSVLLVKQCAAGSSKMAIQSAPRNCRPGGMQSLSNLAFLPSISQKIRNADPVELRLSVTKTWMFS